MDNSVSRVARDNLFVQLKPVCVELCQLALQGDDGISHKRALVDSTTKLLKILETHCQQTDGSFDAKLADYVFFPLSHILRRKKTYTDQLSELIIKCVGILLNYGWRIYISLDLAKQLLILLTFVAGGLPSKDTPPVSEELLYEGFGAINGLFHSLANTPGGSAILKESEMILALGHSVTVILDGITDGPTAKIQSQALLALDGAWYCVGDPETLSQFLPGAVSALTKTLMPSTRNRRTRKVLVGALNILSYVLTLSLGDISTRKLRMKNENSEESPLVNSKGKNMTADWLKSTSAQVRLALINVVKLRNHEAVEVRKALNKFCLTLLDECHDTLSESSSLLVETCMSLHEAHCENEFSNRKTNLKDLALIHADIIEFIKDSLYNWLTSLPKIMGANNETAKISALKNLSKAQTLLAELNLESSILEQTLLKSLHESVMATIDPLVSSVYLQESRVDLNSQAISCLIKQSSNSREFKPIIMHRESQKLTLESFMMLIHTLGMREPRIQLAGEMLEYAKYASGSSLLSSYWLSFQIFKFVSSRNKEIEEIFESSLISSGNHELLGNELLSFSLILLGKNDDEVDDWRLQTIALEVIADAAQRMKCDFRIELVDTLFPVVQFLGSPYSQLRDHAITCLNFLSQYCGYSSSSSLIIENVDYMVNSISLRLNTFNIAPQGPQVLIMMIHLVGPGLLVYLEDVVDSIFAALANYHGYQHLVGVLFSVLAEIVSVGSQSDQLKIAHSQPKICHRKIKSPIPTIENIITTYLNPKNDTDLEILPHEPFPATSWNSAELVDDKISDSNIQSDYEDNHNEHKEVDKPPPSKVYKMLQSITRLSQHYLTSSSPVLRSKLLGLIIKSACSLYHDEDSFLPLVNDIWPVVVKRIYDNETFVCIAACDTIAELCRCAGDFLATRIVVEWPGLLRLARATKLNVSREKKGVGARGIYTQSNQVWEALLRLLTSIVGYVKMHDNMFDELLDLLGNLAWERDEIREALEVVNADAIWLSKYIWGKASVPSTPKLDGYNFIHYVTDKPTM